MINAATVGVHDHKTHMPGFGVNLGSLIVKATPVATTSTSTEQILAWLVSLSLVNILRASFISCVCEVPAGIACKKDPFSTHLLPEFAPRRIKPRPARPRSTRRPV